MRILGFETSCDETAVALVEGNPPGPGTIIHQELYSQLLEHKAYSGVVPEIAARAHLDRLDQLVAKLFEATGIGFNDLDGIAVTSGPGLAGGVLVGLMYAKALAQAQSKSFIAVYHLEAHGLTPRLSHGVAFPYWLLLVSGGHSQILEVRGPRSFIRHGTTIDDAAGEAFDKDLYELPESELTGIPTVAATLREALDSLDKDRGFLKEGGVFTDNLIDAYISLKMDEVLQFEHTPHPVEFKMYYSV